MATNVLAVPSEDLLLETALELFGGGGYEATTMRAIAIGNGTGGRVLGTR